MKNNKLENFPSVYYVSLEECKDRQQSIERQFAEYGIQPTAIISKRFAESDDEITGKFLDQMSDGTMGCVVSHLKAIRKWYEETDEDYAFFCEDDLSLETVQYWDFTWEEFIETIPEDVMCVQLLIIRLDYNTFTLRKREWDDWAGTAYIITRNYAKLLVEHYCLGEKRFHLELPGSGNVLVPLLENVVFESIEKSCYSIPLFVEDVLSFESTFIADRCENGRHKPGHIEAHNVVLNYWKNKMKTFTVRKKSILSIPKNEIELLLENYSNDPENAENNFNLAIWYLNTRHTAPALSYFLRCAERAEDLVIAYEALLWAHYCYEKQGTRDLTAKTLLQHAINLLPSRPEAYFLLAKFHRKREYWTDAYITSQQGLIFAEHTPSPLRNNVGYIGEHDLLYEKAVAGWWWGKSEESKNIFLSLKENYSLSEEYIKNINDNLERIGIQVDEENFFEKEYVNACNTPSDINENLPILFEIAKQCNHITEFGVRSGVSTRAFLNTDAALRSYDLEKDTVVNELFKKAKEDGKNVEYYEGNVLDIEIEETDLIFFDTWHHYDQLKKELSKHANKSKKYLVFHDTQTYSMTGEKCSNTSTGKILTDVIEQPEGLLPAIIEFIVDAPQWTFKTYKKNNNGMIILEKKNY